MRSLKSGFGVRFRYLSASGAQKGLYTTRASDDSCCWENSPGHLAYTRSVSVFVMGCPETDEHEPTQSGIGHLPSSIYHLAPEMLNVPWVLAGGLRDLK